MKVDALQYLINITSETNSRLELRAFIALFSAIQINYKNKSIAFPLSKEISRRLLERAWEFKNSEATKNFSYEAKEYIDCIINCLNESIASGGYSWTNHRNLYAASQSILERCGKLVNHNKHTSLYPSTIHLESYALCNAKCSFCDYNELSRKGTKMPDHLVDKVINELSTFPSHHSFLVQPYKISEPFLDPRLPDIAEKVLAAHPKSSVHIISNGNYIPEDMLAKIEDIAERFMVKSDTKNDVWRSRIRLTFSLNEVNEENYQKLMKLNFSKTVENLKKIHIRMNSRGFYPFNIALTRVSTNYTGDVKFLLFCKKVFPRFTPFLAKMNNWAKTNTFSCDTLGEEPTKSYSKFSCSRWSDLSIMANGKIALCCMDSGNTDLEIGDISKSDCISLYRKKVSQYVPTSYQRGDAPSPCATCTYGQSNDSRFIYEHLIEATKSDEFESSIIKAKRQFQSKKH